MAATAFRRVLGQLLGAGTEYVMPAPPVREGYPVTRRAVAGLLGVRLPDRPQRAEPASGATAADITDNRDSAPADGDLPAHESEFHANDRIAIDPEVPESARHVLADIFSGTFSGTVDAKEVHPGRPTAGGLDPLAGYVPLIPFATTAPPLPPHPAPHAAWKAWRRDITRRSRAEIEAEWMARNAAIIYHRRYVVPRTDFDSEVQPIWARAVAATNVIRDSDVMRHLVGSAQALALLPHRLWTIAESLARLTQARTRQRDIIRRAGPVSDQVTAKVAQQTREMEHAERRIKDRVSQLEHVVSLLEQAVAAMRDQATPRQLDSLDEELLDLVENSADVSSDAYRTERAVVQEVIDQISEALLSLAATES